MSDFRFDDIDGDSDGEDGEGFSWGGRDASIFLIDASAQMHTSEQSDEDTPFKRAIKCANSTLCRKIISQDQDLSAVVFFNTRETKNDTDFSNIYVLQNLDRPGAERVIELEQLNSITNKMFDQKYGFSTAASLADALWACKSLFNKCKSKLSGQSILLFTCNDDPHASDTHEKNRVKTEVKTLQEAEIELELLHMGSSFDIKKFYKELLLQDEDDDSASAYTLADPTNRLEELMDRVRRVNHKQRSSGRVTFTIGPGIEFGVGFYTAIRKTTKPSKMKLFKVTNEEVKTMRKQYLEETGALLMPSDFQQSQCYGGKEIKFTLDEVKGLRKVYTPGVHLLGFKPMSFIKPYLYVKPANFIYADESNIQGSTKIFAALLERCLSRKVVALARVIPRTNASVAWAALIPQAEEMDDKNCQITPPGFQVSYLPFADDFRTLNVEKRATANADQIDAAKEVMKKLTFKYHPDCFENPDLQTHWRNIEALALNKADLEPVTDYTVPDYDRMSRKAGPLLDAFKTAVYEPDYDPSVAIKKPTVRAPPAKKLKPDPSSINVEDMAKAGTVQKLTVDVLKSWLQSKNVSVTGKKKAQLVQDVYDELGITE